MEPSARGWLPVTIGLDSQSEETVVRWLEFGSAKLSGTVLQTDGRKTALRTEPPASEAQSGLDTLLERGERLRPVTPAGFIFHVSRCGSTLIANALKTAERAVSGSPKPVR